MQGLGFAIVGNLQRAWNNLLVATMGKPEFCRACGRRLIFDPEPRTFQPEPAYYCPGANEAMGAHIIRGFVVVECDF